MAKRGKLMYAPGIFIEELDDIKQEQNIDSGSEACRKLTKYARVGREVERIKNLDFRRMPTPFNKKRGKS